MEDILILKYPTKGEKIRKLRSMGVSDSDIESGMKAKISDLKNAGIPTSDINEALGIDNSQRLKIAKAHIGNTMEFMGDIFKMTPEQVEQTYRKSAATGLPINTVAMRPDIPDPKPIDLREMMKSDKNLDRNWIYKDANTRTILRNISSVSSGLYSTAGSMVSSVEWLTGFDAAGKAADFLYKQAEVTGNMYVGKDGHNLMDQVFQGFGSTAMFLLPGKLAQNAAQATAAVTSGLLGLNRQGALSLAQWLGSSVSGVMEGLAEGGDVYHTIYKQTGNEAAAAAGASKAFWYNIPLNIVLDKFAFFDGASPTIKNFFMRGMSETNAEMAAGISKRFGNEFIQETMQGAISENAVSGREWADMDWMGLAAENGLVGGLAGAMFGIGIKSKGAINVETPEQATARQEAVGNIYTTIKDSAVSAGLDEHTADANARVLSSFYNTMSARYGIDAGELFAKRSLSVQGTEDGGYKVEGASYAQEDKGQITFGEDKTVIDLFKSSDKSTMIHEVSHLMLEEFSGISSTVDNASAAAQDWANLAAWLGAEHGKPLSKEAHEKFARAMETYLMTDRAPKSELKGVFASFRQWLLDIYHNIKALNIDMTPEIRDVFDRMLATDEEIRTVNEEAARREADALRGDNLPTPDSEESRAMEEADAILNGEEEILFNPEWFSTYDSDGKVKDGDERVPALPEDDGTDTFSPEAFEGFNNNANEGRDAVDELIQAEDIIDQQKTLLAEWKSFTDQIIQRGGLLYSSVKEMLGDRTAQDLYKAARRIFKATGTPLDEMIANLELAGELTTQDEQAFIRRLLAKPEIPTTLPIVEVTDLTVPWLEERMGTNKAAKYIARRIRDLEKHATALTADIEALENTNPTDPIISDMRLAREAAYNELIYAREALKDVQSRIEKPTAKPDKVVTFGEQFAKAKLQAAHWVDKTLMSVILEITGQTPVGALISEEEAIRKAYKMCERESRVAYFAGNRAGVLMMKARAAELKRRMKLREAIKKETAKMIHDLDNAMVGNIRVHQREQIRDRLSKYDLKKRTKDTLADRKRMEEYFASHPEAIPTPDEQDKYYLGRRVLNDMSMDELRALHEEIMAIREVGKIEYKLWQQERKDRLTGVRDELIAFMGGRQRRTGERHNGRLTKDEKLLHKIAVWTWLPDSVTRWMDKDVNGGLWHELLVNRANLAEDAKVKIMQRRRNRLNEGLKILGFEHGYDDSRWYQERTNDVDPKTGEACVWSADGLMNIYVGWQNTRFREALMYGLNITPERYSALMKHLTDNEKEAAALIIRDHAAEKDELNKLFEDVYNQHLTEEENYTRLYRDSFQSDGMLMSATDRELLDDLAMQINGSKKFYASKGFTFERKDIPESMQAKTPPKLGLFQNWSAAMEEEAHWVGYAELVRDLHTIVEEQWKPDTPTLMETVTKTYGKETADFLGDYINRIARSHFYSGYTAMDAAMRTTRKKMSIAFLCWNYMVWFKQLTVFALTAPTVGAGNMMMSMARFVADPKKMIEMVWALDPQVAEQAVARETEEMKRTVATTFKERFVKTGFKPLMWFDMFARVVVWDAMYQKQYRALTSKGMGAKEAHERARVEAQSFVLRTNNAAAPKDLPRYMAHDETMNLLATFTNQANKVWNLTTYTAPHQLFQKGERGKSFATFAGLMMMGIMTQAMSKGAPPDDPEELLAWMVSEPIGSTPLVGKAMVSAMAGFSGRGNTIFDNVGGDIIDVGKNLYKGDFFTADNASTILELYALATNVPYTPLHRAIKTAKSGNPAELFGWGKATKRKKPKLPAGMSYYSNQ